MQGSLSTIGLSASVPYKSFLKVSIRYVSNFSELISSDQFSPQQMQCKYHNGNNIPPHPTQFSQAHGAAMIMDTCAFLNLFIFVEFRIPHQISTPIPHCGTPYSILWDLIFHNVECKKLYTSSTQNSLNMFYYDH